MKVYALEPRGSFMCLILIAHQLSEQTPLLVLANRDEFYNRPAVKAEVWPETPDMVAGRDLVSGGSWFGARGRRWASVTNVREGNRNKRQHSRSRGWLVRDYLQGDLEPESFLAFSRAQFQEFDGFNLLLGDGEELWYSSNRQLGDKRLQPGIYGLSNHLLDTPWPKVLRGKNKLGKLCVKTRFNHNEAFALLADTTQAADAELPDTGVPYKWEKALSATFIRTPDYGTRCSTFLKLNADYTRQFIERRFAGNPRPWEESAFHWTASGSLLDREDLSNENSALSSQESEEARHR